MSLTYRWLGVAGLEFALDGYTLLVDPFFTRPSKPAVLSNARVYSNTQLVQRYITGGDAVLVTHPHYDHLLDVPAVLRQTGAEAYGSANACTLLALMRIPPRQAHAIQPGDRLELGPFQVQVYPARHTRIPLRRLFNGPLPPRLRRKSVRLPLRLSDYRMDACYSFRIQAAGRTLLVGNHPIPADVLFIAPYNPGSYLQAVLHAVQPEQVVPIHWDDFTRRLSRPLRPMLLTPAQGLRPRFPPLRRLNLAGFTAEVQALVPNARVEIPEIFQINNL